MLKPRYIVFFVALLAIVLHSCSTKKNKFINRSFHNLTAHYNGHFYAEESIKEGVLKIEKTHKDDYTKILPVFIYAPAQEAKNIYPEMDRAIKKSSTVIQRHTITDRKEREIPGAVKWTDENYMCIGRAHFYKHDFFSAIEAFDYVSKAYTKSPTRYLAKMWMIRTYNEIGSFTMSTQIIDDLNNDKEFPKNFNSEYAAVLADYYLKRENYESAIKHLAKAAVTTKKKKNRIRYAYILAQVYEKTNDIANARSYYNRVIELHPPYEITFNARMKLAKLYDVKSGDSKELKKTLSKMLKDEKNKDYQDQIYYALAEIEEKENNIPGTIDYLKLSIQKSISNNNQKALSYLKLGEIYFAKPEYKNAAAYFDSTIMFLSKDFPDYEKINERKTSLAELVNNLNIISLEDSLQKLALMSEADRNKVIEKLIAQVEEEEKKKKEEQENQQLNTNNTNTNQSTSQNTFSNSSGQWYFYNPATVSFGTNEFIKVWGQRKLEDNWRRLNKESADAFLEMANQTDTSTVNSAALQKAATLEQRKTKEFYLKDIPFSASAKEKSTQKIINSYYSVGVIYKERFADNKKSAETFEELLKKYPKNKYELSSYYLLYRIYLAANNLPRADYYKKLILNDFPESEYARIIKNPDYNKQIMAGRNVVENFYTQTYELYEKGNYTQVLANCRYADSLYAKNFLTPKFDYLNALAIGRTASITDFEKALTQVSAKHSKHEVGGKAQEMLDMIKQQKSSATLNNSQKFKFEKDSDYYWLIIIKNGKSDLNKFKIKLSDYNKKYFELAALTINSSFIDDSNQMIIVKALKGKDVAMDYYNFIKTDKEILKDLEANSYTHFVISSTNYNTLFKEKNISDYEAFFKDNFLGK